MLITSKDSRSFCQLLLKFNPEKTFSYESFFENSSKPNNFTESHGFVHPFSEKEVPAVGFYETSKNCPLPIIELCFEKLNLKNCGFEISFQVMGLVDIKNIQYHTNNLYTQLTSELKKYGFKPPSYEVKVYSENNIVITNKDTEEVIYKKQVVENKEELFPSLHL